VVKRITASLFSNNYWGIFITELSFYSLNREKMSVKEIPRLSAFIRRFGCVSDSRDQQQHDQEETLADLIKVRAKQRQEREAEKRYIIMYLSA